MKRAFKNQRQSGSAVISAEGSRDLCIGTCSLAPPTTCPTLMTRERGAYGPTRASSDVPETGDGGGQWRRGARRGGRGARSLLGRIKVLNNCTYNVWRRSAPGSGRYSPPRALVAVSKRVCRHSTRSFKFESYTRDINEVEQQNLLSTKQQQTNAVISWGSVVTSHTVAQIVF